MDAIMDQTKKKFSKFALRCYRKGYSFSMQHNLHLFKPPPMPHYLQLEITNDCNMQCSHCSRQRFMDDRSVGYMDFKLFRKIIDEISSSSQCFVRIGGLGEQALHPDFEKMMGYLAEHSIRYEVVTNGLLLTRFNPQQLLHSGIEILGVSVDGNDSVSYNKIRRGGDYDTLREEVMKFYTEKKKSQRALPELQIRNVIFPNTTAEQIRTFKRAWMPYSDYVRFNTFTSGKEEEVTSPKRCTEIDFTLYIRWDGKVPLCGHQHWYCNTEWVGDVGKEPLQRIWNNPRLNALRNAHYQRNLGAFEFCKRCSKTQYSEQSKHNIIKWNQHRNPLISSFRSIIQRLSWLK